MENHLFARIENHFQCRYPKMSSQTNVMKRIHILQIPEFSHGDGSQRPCISCRTFIENSSLSILSVQNFGLPLSVPFHFRTRQLSVQTRSNEEGQCAKSQPLFTMCVKSRELLVDQECEFFLVTRNRPLNVCHQTRQREIEIEGSVQVSSIDVRFFAFA